MHPKQLRAAAARDAEERHRLMIWSESSQICDDDRDPLSFDLRPLAGWIAHLFGGTKRIF